MSRTFNITRFLNTNYKFIRRLTMRRRIYTMHLNNIGLRQQDSLQRTSHYLHAAFTDHVNRTLHVITHKDNSGTADRLLVARKYSLIMNTTGLRQSNSLRVLELRRGLVSNRIKRRLKQGSYHITHDTLRSFNN